VPAVMVIRSKAGWGPCLWASHSGKLMGQEGLDSVVERTHTDADDGTELGAGHDVVLGRMGTEDDGR